MWFKTRGDFAKSLCFLPYGWVRLVFWLLLQVLEHLCRVRSCQFWPPSGDSLSLRDFSKYIPLTTPLTKFFFWVPYKCAYILLLVHVYAFYMVGYTFWSMYLHFRTHFALFYFSTMCELCPEQPFSWYDCLSGGKIWESSLVAPGKPLTSPCWSVIDKILCFHLLAHFSGHNSWLAVLKSTYFFTFISI